MQRHVAAVDQAPCSFRIAESVPEEHARQSHTLGPSRLDLHTPRIIIAYEATVSSNAIRSHARLVRELLCAGSRKMCEVEATARVITTGGCSLVDVIAVQETPAISWAA